MPQQIHLVLDRQGDEAGQRLDNQLGPHGKGRSFFSNIRLLQIVHQGEEPDDDEARAGHPQRQG